MSLMLLSTHPVSGMTNRTSKGCSRIRVSHEGDFVSAGKRFPELVLKFYYRHQCVDQFDMRFMKF